jgi:REP element-mobilizing transposase RayT
MVAFSPNEVALMARLARADVFDPLEVSVFHCLNRCVRQCFLCGEDPTTGRNYEHRKTWLESRMKFLAALFGIDVLGFSIMSNHFHLVLRNRPDVVATWSDAEVARRWLHLCPLRKEANGTPTEPSDPELATICNVPERLAEIRRRLSDISWLMRMISEPIARRANAEDQANGRFWQGRFKAVKLCDEAAILACLAYIDLNPIRAGLAESPESSDFTSAQRRIESLPGEENSAPPAAPNNTARRDAWLSPVDLREGAAEPGPQPNLSGQRASDKGFLPMTALEYLELVEWTGRQVVRGKSQIPASLPPLLARLGIAADDWLPLAQNFGKLFHRVAGAPCSLARLSQQTSHRYRRGQAQLLGQS